MPACYLPLSSCVHHRDLISCLNLPIYLCIFCLSGQLYPPSASIQFSDSDSVLVSYMIEACVFLEVCQSLVPNHFIAILMMILVIIWTFLVQCCIAECSKILFTFSLNWNHALCLLPAGHMIQWCAGCSVGAYCLKKTLWVNFKPGSSCVSSGTLHGPVRLCHIHGLHNCGLKLSCSLNIN